MSGFSVFHWIVFAAVIAVIVMGVRGLGSGLLQGKTKFCTTCGHEGGTESKTRGSFLIEIILWLCFIVPGLIYSIWRVSSRHPVCASCGAATLVPPDSPMAKAQRKSLGLTT